MLSSAANVLTLDEDDDDNRRPKPSSSKKRKGADAEPVKYFGDSRVPNPLPDYLRAPTAADRAALKKEAWFTKSDVSNV